MLSGSGPPRDSSFERVDRGELITGEFEVKDVEVLGDASWLRRLRDRGTALLQMPPKHHLRGRLAMLARNLPQRRVIEGASSRHRDRT